MARGPLVTPESWRERLPETVLVGRIRRAHGVRGDLLVETLSDIRGRFARGATLWVVPAAGARRRMQIAQARPHQDALLVHFEQVATREDAERLAGAELEVPVAECPQAPEGSFYYFELVGCDCRDATLGLLGRVGEVLEDGGGLLLRVDSPGRQLLVPFVRAYLKSVDIEGGVIEVDVPEGLLETCRSKS